MRERLPQLRKAPFRITPDPAMLYATPLPASERPLVAARVVRREDTLLRAALDVCGFPLDEALRRVVEQNPRISDVHWVQAGAAGRSLDVSDLQARGRGSTSPGRQRP